MSKFIVQHRRGTSAQWAASNIVPYRGEIVIEECQDGSFKTKVGDGYRTFNELGYTSASLDFDGIHYDQETGLLHITMNGEDIVDPCFIGGGGGSGGGSSNNATIAFTNTTGWLWKTVAENATCVLSGAWSSLEGGISTGNGTLTVRVDGVIKQVKDIPQGDFTIDVTAYLHAGSNIIKLTVADVYGNSRTVSYTLTLISLHISSDFDASIAYAGNITYSYTPTGSVVKTIHFVLDGVEQATVDVSTSGRQQNYIIPEQTHGAHSFETYLTAEIDGQSVESNHLYYDLICLASGNNTPIIAIPFNRTTVAQYENVGINYKIYSPLSLTSNITLSANGGEVSSLTVDRTQQTWTYRPDDVGTLTLTIACGLVTRDIVLTVTQTIINAIAETENLELYLSSYGRNNQEVNKNVWSYRDINCSFANYNWVSDGWQMDADGNTVHRVTGDARLTIPLQIFANDFRTTGKTIEIEFATRDILNYDATIVSCYSGDRGLHLTAQKATLKSEQTEIFTQYKEDEHIRLSFVVEKRSEHQLVYIYLNGIMCGATQYPTQDDFSQISPVNITIGSNDCTIDIYNIRVYNNNLTRYQILENWIADTQNITEKLNRYYRNNIYDAYGAVIINNLPSDLPYMILEAPILPQYKGNKLNVNATYVDPVNPLKSFTSVNAQADVQGTSSAGYARKNYKIKFRNGFVQNGETVNTYALRVDSIPTNTFTFKADVASSEGANNVELVRLYNSACPYQTPPQEENAHIRQGIDGFPIVIFHNNGTTTEFVGKYNFNHDKGTPEVFGFDDGDESWEILNNTSGRVLFQSADFTGTDWQNDFEARYPEDNVDVSTLAAFVAWVVSTDQTAATGNALSPVVVYNGVTYSTDTAAYRLAKFKAELSNYVELDSTLFYYLFTELFLMVDSRAKNAFPSSIGGDKICWLPYDMDTAIGINNEGTLAFSYELEDIDHTAGGADIYNGQTSVLWINLRQAFGEELKAMYQTLRSNNLISYSGLEQAYETHQAKWPEAIWNEDAYYKYLQPLFDDNTSAYLSMLQGSKSEQRKWWLYNRFRYIDSKYNAGDSLRDFVTLRGYAIDNITVRPYADIYATVKYGSYLVQQRALRGTTYTLVCPLDNLNDTEIYIYSASQLLGIGDLSGLKVGYADFSMATKLSSLKIGDADPLYINGNLTELYLGNNTLLQSLDVRNCPNLTQAVNISGCTNIENVYFNGTGITSLQLPSAGNLKNLYLPATITNLTITNQPSITNFSCAGYANVTTLRLENSNVDSLTIVTNCVNVTRLRVLGVAWTLSNLQLLRSIMNSGGLDENGNNTAHAVLAGNIYIDGIVGWAEDVREYYSESLMLDYPAVINDSGNLYIQKVAVSQSGAELTLT